MKFLRCLRVFILLNKLGNSYNGKIEMKNDDILHLKVIKNKII